MRIGNNPNRIEEKEIKHTAKILTQSDSDMDGVKDLEDLCPTAKCDEIFASQYDSVITNPPKEPVPDNDYVIPSS